VVIAFMKRSVLIEGERYGWQEWLLWAAGAGFRWLVKNEGKWFLGGPISPAELDLGRRPKSVTLGNQSFELKDRGRARVDYVIGEVFWKCAVGEEVDLVDYAARGQVLTREQSPGEVQWTHSIPLDPRMVAAALGRRA
jgi:hypothetical protein